MELNISLSVWESCSQLDTGQEICISGICSSLHAGSEDYQDELSVLAKRQETSICLLLQSMKDRPFENNFLPGWRCELTSCIKFSEEPMHDRRQLNSDGDSCRLLNNLWDATQSDDKLDIPRDCDVTPHKSLDPGMSVLEDSGSGDATAGTDPITGCSLEKSTNPLGVEKFEEINEDLASSGDHGNNSGRRGEHCDMSSHGDHHDELISSEEHAGATETILRDEIQLTKRASRARLLSQRKNNRRSSTILESIGIPHGNKINSATISKCRKSFVGNSSKKSKLKPDRSKIITKEAQKTSKSESCQTFVKSERRPRCGKRGNKEELLELNARTISAMIDSGQDGFDYLQGQDWSRRFVCCMCKRMLLKNIWSTITRHIEDCHFINVDVYRDVLLMENYAEKLEKIDYYLSEERLRRKKIKAERKKPPDDKSVQCIRCESYLSSFASYKTHVMTVHSKDDNYQELIQNLEEVKDREVASSIHLSARTHLELTCDYCGVIKTGMRAMSLHIKLLHAAEPDREESLNRHRAFIHLEVERGERKFRDREPCRFCGESLYYNARKRHEMFSCSQNPDRIHRYQCSYCMKSFLDKKILQEHRKEHQAQPNKNVNICDICGSLHETRTYLNQHKRRVHPTKPPSMQCKYCHKMFHEKRSLQAHAVKHSDVRPHQCETCGSRFKTKTNLLSHQNVMHKNKYPYYCTSCGHGVAKKSYLKAHICGRTRRPQESSLGLHDSTVAMATTTQDHSAMDVNVGDKMAETGCVDAGVETSIEIITLNQEDIPGFTLQQSVQHGFDRIFF